MDDVVGGEGVAFVPVEADLEAVAVGKGVLKGLLEDVNGGDAGDAATRQVSPKRAQTASENGPTALVSHTRHAPRHSSEGDHVSIPQIVDNHAEKLWWELVEPSRGVIADTESSMGLERPPATSLIGLSGDQSQRLQVNFIEVTHNPVERLGEEPMPTQRHYVECWERQDAVLDDIRYADKVTGVHLTWIIRVI